MSDPLSVAGSAVGIISLGIQVCNGLLVYADAIRGRSQDLNVQDHLDQVRPLPEGAHWPIVMPKTSELKQARN